MKQINRTVRRLVVASLISSTPCLAAAAAGDAPPSAAAPEQPGVPIDGANPAPRPEASQQLDAVVVTAQKRKENLSEVPISISVVTGEQLQRRHISSYEDLTRIVPDLSSTNGGGSGYSNIEIRGISSASGTATVGTYLDDVSMTVPSSLGVGATEPRFFDIDQIEVLRGPQGTLYGASSLGGTIKFTSRQPDPLRREASLSSDLSFTAHGGFNHVEQGVLNLPVSPGISALRLGIQYSETSGYIDQRSPALAADGVTPLPQTVTAKGINSERAIVLRGSFKYERDGLVILPALFLQRLKSDNTDLFDLDSYRQTAKLVQETGSDAFFLPSLTIKDDLGWADLTSVTSYFWRHFRSIRDGTTFNSAYLAELLAADTDLAASYPGVDPAPVGVRPGPANYTPNVLQGSEELRLTSKSMQETGLPYSWLAGLYVSKQHSHFSDNEFVSGAIETLGDLYGTDGRSILSQNLQHPVENGGAGLTPEQAAIAVASGNDVYFNESSEDDRQASVFGEFSYAPIQPLTLTVGARYLVARTGVKNTVGGYYNADAPTQVDTVSKAYSFTPKFSARYALARNSSVYATAVKGFRLGGANLQIPNYGCKDNEAALGIGDPGSTYNPDSLWSYELGTKNSFLGNRLSVDASVYYIDWKHVQQQIILSTCGFDFTENAGSAESYGVDLALRGKLTRHLTASLNGSRTEAKIVRAATGSGAEDGSRLLGVPRWALTPALSYAGALTDRISAVATLDWSLVGPSNGAFMQDDPDFKRPQYGLLGTSIGLGLPGNIDVSVYAKNLLDEGKIIQRVERLGVNQGYILRPRTIGMTLNVGF